MRSKKFSHFEVFKVVITTLYITSGILMFSTLISNASQEYKQVEVIDSYSGATIYDCENCDEID
jgi:hypothetical protein